MASTYTTRLGFERQADGENSGTWGSRLNSNVIDLIDAAIAGLTSVALSSAPITLTDNDGSSDQSRSAILYLHGVLTSNCQVVVPSATKSYTIYNNCTGNFNPIIKTAGGAGSPVPRGAMSEVFCDTISVWIDGTSIGKALTQAADVTAARTAIGYGNFSSLVSASADSTWFTVSAGKLQTKTSGGIGAAGGAFVLDYSTMSATTSVSRTTAMIALRKSDGVHVVASVSRLLKVAQIASNKIATVDTGTTLIPLDNTKPAATSEGKEFLACPITPTDANSTLVIDVKFNGAVSVGPNTIIAMLTQNNVSDALSVGIQRAGEADQMYSLSFSHVMTAGTTSTITFGLRAGPTVASTLTMNGRLGAQLFDGTLYSSITVTEILP